MTITAEQINRRMMEQRRTLREALEDLDAASRAAATTDHAYRVEAAKLAARLAGEMTQAQIAMETRALRARHDAKLADALLQAARLRVRGEIAVCSLYQTQVGVVREEWASLRSGRGDVGA